MTGDHPHRRSIGVIRSLRRRSPVSWAALIGAAVALSVLIAWMPWRLTEPRAGSRSPIVPFHAGDRVYGVSPDRDGGIRRQAYIYPMGVRDPSSGEPDPNEPGPAWLPVGDIRHPERAGLRLIYAAQANGWPFPCVYAVEGASLAGGRAHGRAIHIALRTPVRCDRVLPYGVIWWGMLANVAIYALALLSVWEVVGLVRRERRRRRSRCGWCGYDLIGAPDARCPECGTSNA